VTVQSELLPEYNEKQIVKKFHIVVFRYSAFLAVACCLGKPEKSANSLPADQGNNFSLIGEVSG
jgi:hypothetical protein